MQENSDLFDFKILPDSKQEILDTTRWINILSVMTFSICAAVLLIFIAGWSIIKEIILKLTAASTTGDIPSSTGNFVMIFVFIGLFIGVGIFSFIVYFLFRSAKKIKKGLTQNDQELFNAGLADMKTYFTVTGIFAMFGAVMGLISIF